jgi:[citrate (pro-3S)-lyase] ligase
MHLFLYTKVESALFFGDLGFHEIARVDGTLVFMENRRNGFAQYLEGLKRETEAAGAAAGSGAKETAAIVMNANPFTLGHQFLVETAAAACGTLHLFVVSEDASLVPFAVRKRLIREGTAHIPNVILHDSGPYMISSATFPSYFLKDEASVITGHAKLDIQIFTKIAGALGIAVRYVGEEPASEVTGIYNRIMTEELPKAGIVCRVIPRRTVSGDMASGAVISASTVRQCLQKEDWQSLRALVPETTLRYFQSAEAAPVLKQIREAGDVVHY